MKSSRRVGGMVTTMCGRFVQTPICGVKPERQDGFVDAKLLDSLIDLSPDRY